jgi:hypothetical protein
MDSDGQCDPRFFKDLWNVREDNPVVFGFRVQRDDGRVRWFISRIVSFVGWLGSGAWVADANVPYRLMHRDALEQSTRDMPADFHLANILLALRLKKPFGIHWNPSHFRDRFGGSPSVKAYSFVKQGARLFKQLRQERSKRGS